MTYLIEYLGEFEFILETILDHESRDHMGSFNAKKTPSKISCLGTFKETLITECNLYSPIPGTLKQRIILLRPFLGNTPTECNRGLECQ